MLYLISFSILITFIGILYKYILKPYVKVLKIKFKYKEEVRTCFFPIVGHYYKALNPNNINHL